MTAIRTIDDADIEAFRRHHNRHVDRDEPLEQVRAWHREHPELLLGAYGEGELVGHCLGVPWTDAVVELRGIAVDPLRRRSGLGTALLSAFEDRAVELGYRRVTLGSAGGYVDRFYVENGYEAERVLVRLDADAPPPDEAAREFTLADERVEAGTRTGYVDVDGYDPAVLEAVREAFVDPEAVFVMSKDLDSGARSTG